MTSQAKFPSVLPLVWDKKSSLHSRTGAGLLITPHFLRLQGKVSDWYLLDYLKDVLQYDEDRIVDSFMEVLLRYEGFDPDTGTIHDDPEGFKEKSGQTAFNLAASARRRLLASRQKVK